MDGCQCPVQILTGGGDLAFPCPDTKIQGDLVFLLVLLEIHVEETLYVLHTVQPENGLYTHLVGKGVRNDCC